MTVVLGVATACVAALTAEEQESTDAPLKRARKQVRMLDDLYKTSIVLITQTYVDDESDVAAIVGAKALFQTMKEKGHHTTELLDATGQPYEEANVPNDDFEKQAVKELLAGKTYVDREETRDGKRYLRAATAVPVVLKQCTICHPHYSDVKKGQAIGMLSYTIEIE